MPIAHCYEQYSHAINATGVLVMTHTENNLTLQLASIIWSFIVLFTEGHRFSVFTVPFVAAATAATIEALAVIVPVITVAVVVLKTHAAVFKADFAVVPIVIPI